MKKLLSIGFFSELPYGDQSGGSLSDAVGKVSEIHKDKIVLYLKTGKALAVAPGISMDSLLSSKKIIGGISIKTDGVFAWPNDLSYYVHEYGVGIPDEFLRHMEMNNWVVPAVDLTTLEL